jgi:hypothetical protein
MPWSAQSGMLLERLGIGGVCAMRSYCAEWPEFHPEFGLLCPSARQRRFARVATVFFITIMVVGASRVLAAAHRPSPEDTYLAMLLKDEAPVDPPIQVALLSEDTDEATPAPPADPCKSLSPDDLAGYFLNPGCKIQGRRGQHHINNVSRGVATFVFARVEPPPAPLSALALAMQQVTTKVTTKVAEIEKRANAATQRTASVKKHKLKDAAPTEIAHAPARPGGMPGTIVTAYSPETKLSRSHGPFTDAFPRGQSRPGFDSSAKRTW